MYEVASLQNNFNILSMLKFNSWISQSYTLPANYNFNL